MLFHSYKLSQYTGLRIKTLMLPVCAHTLLLIQKDSNAVFCFVFLADHESGFFKLIVLVCVLLSSKLMKCFVYYIILYYAIITVCGHPDIIRVTGLSSFIIKATGNLALFKFHIPQLER